MDKSPLLPKPNTKGKRKGRKGIILTYITPSSLEKYLGEKGE